MQQPEAWRENDRLRAEASAILVDAALAADVKTYVQPTVTFVYPGGRPVSEETPVGMCRSSCAPHSPPNGRPPGSPWPGGAVWCCASGFSTARAPERTIRTRAWEPHCTLRTPAARCSRRSMSPAASITCAATASVSVTAVSPQPSAGVPCDNAHFSCCASAPRPGPSRCRRESCCSPLIFYHPSPRSGYGVPAWPRARGCALDREEYGAERVLSFRTR